MALWLVRLVGLAIQIRHRRRPLAVVAVPIVVAAIWLLTGTRGEAFLGWTACSVNPDVLDHAVDRRPSGQT